MATVKQLIATKKNAANYSVSANDTVLRALQVMAQASIGSVLVTDQNKYIGIFTERDYARKGELAGRAAKDTRVRDVMTGEMYTH